MCVCVCDRFLQEVIGLNSSKGAFQRSNIGFFFFPDCKFIGVSNWI